MSPNATARILTLIQRSCLIEHVNGPLPFEVGGVRQTKQSLIDDGLIRPVAGQHLSRCPRVFCLTDLGRQVACIVLGEYADALVRAGFVSLPLTESQLSSAIVTDRRRTLCLTTDLSPVAADSVAVSVPLIPPIS